MAKKLLKFRSLIKNSDFWLVILVLVLGLSTGFFKNLFNPPAFARVEIDFGAKKRAFQGEILSNTSLLDALIFSSQAGNIEVKYVISEDKTDIVKIDGLVEDGLNHQSWSFYLNGQKVQTAEIHKIKLKPGDKIKVRFE